MHAIAERLLKATELDEQIKAAQAQTGSDDPAPEQIAAAEASLKRGVRVLLTPTLRKLLNEIQARDEIVIDDVSVDTVLFAGYEDSGAAQGVITSFQAFIDANRDEIDALKILYNTPYRTQRLAWAQINELAERLKQPPYLLTADKLWAAYAKMEPERVRMTGTKRLLTDLIALVRHAIQPESDLIPYPEQVQARYDAWLAAQRAAGKVFTPAQMEWLNLIAEHMGVNLTVEPGDFNSGRLFERGGIQAALQAFGDAAALEDAA